VPWLTHFALDFYYKTLLALLPQEEAETTHANVSRQAIRKGNRKKKSLIIFSVENAVVFFYFFS
jgi:hypothetical protein